MRFRMLLVAATLVTTGCGGGAHESMATIPVPAPMTAAVTVPAAALSTDDVDADADAIDVAASDDTERPMDGASEGWEDALPRPQRDPAGVQATRQVESYYGNQNAGIGGESILSATTPSPKVNLIAHHSLYHGAEWSGGTQINLLTPASSQIGDVVLYAPTMKAPNGDCLEAGTAYYNGGSFTNNTTHAYIYAFDFCSGPGKTLHPDTVTGWFQKYVRINADGVPKYVVQICNCKNKETWSVRYFNHKTKEFDTFYTTTGYYSGFGLGGWTQFETQYNVSAGTTAACSPSLPVMEDSDVHFVIDDSNKPLTAKTSTPYSHNPGETSFGAFGKCFNFNTTPASYVFSYPSDAHKSWRVASTGS